MYDTTSSLTFNYVASISIKIFDSPAARDRKHTTSLNIHCIAYKVQSSVWTFLATDHIWSIRKANSVNAKFG